MKRKNFIVCTIWKKSKLNIIRSLVRDSSEQQIFVTSFEFSIRNASQGYPIWYVGLILGVCMGNLYTVAWQEPKCLAWQPNPSVDAGIPDYAKI